MRFGLWALLAVLLGAFVAHFVLEDRGYVLLNFRGYVVEMSVPGLVLMLVALYLAVRGLIALARLPRSLQVNVARRRARRSGENVGRGLMHLLEGDFARAERLLTRANDAPLVGYLLAARAAQSQGAPARRDEWLKLAYDASPESRPAVLLAQAELELDAGDLDAVQTTLERLEELKPDHPGAVGLLARVYRARDDAPALAALLPRLARAHMPAPERDALAAEALRMELASQDLGDSRLDEIWRGLGKDLRAAAPLIALRARALDRLGRGPEAERELKAALKKDWHRDLVLAYGEVHGADSQKQLKQAEAWLKTYPEDPALLLTAARLCIQGELWGKARSYLESSIALAPAPEAYALYGKLLAQLGDGERAAVAFRSGLALASPTAAETLDPSPPQLEPPAKRPSAERPAGEPPAAEASAR
jgi:HemY protein